MTEFVAPFDALSLSLSFAAIIVPCFVSIFHLQHKVLTNCVCFNTTSKPIELERHTTFQISRDIRGI